MVAPFLLSSLFLAIDAAHPVSPNLSTVKLSFTKCVGTSVINLVKHNQLRVKTLEAKAQDLEDPAVISSLATNRVTSYIASVRVGSPATYCK